MKTINYHNQALPVNKIICVGRNYAAHIEELGNAVPDEMALFIKSNTAITHSPAAQHLGDDIHFEAEICFLIKDNQFIAVSVGLDLTKRDVQTKLKKAGLPWERAKGFVGAALFAPFVDLPEDINQLSLQLDIDGKTQQQGGVPLMIYSPNVVLTECQQQFGFTDNDIIMTGTPEGVGKLQTGQQLHVKLFAGNKLLTEQHWQVC